MIGTRGLPVQEGKQIQHTQARQNMPVNLGHQLALGGGRERREFGVERWVMDLRRIDLAFAIVGGLQLPRFEFCTGTKEVVSADLHIFKLTAHAGRHAPEGFSIGR